ncbi:MAG: signal peptidase II [Terriglobia bacterium]
MKPTLNSRAFALLLAALVVGLDQVSKWIVSHSLALGETRRIVPGLFNLTHLHNRGAAFGLLSDFDSAAVVVFLISFSAAALLLVVSLLWRTAPFSAAGWGLALILGGALGNLIDRLRNGSVVDFLDFHLSGYHWPAFNLADSAIVIGAAVLLAQALRSRGGLAHEV